jgi:hypothetical protein
LLIDSETNPLVFFGDNLNFNGDPLIFGSNEGYAIFIDLRIIVEPIYPTPDLGGPMYNKWKPEVPEYRVITNTNEGGCDETYLRNRVATYKWTVEYTGLTYEEPCAPQLCCDQDIGFVGGFSPDFQTAKVLDNFWNFVYGTYGHFTLIEPRTRKKWLNVRFETNMTRDHDRWKNEQQRTVTLMWTPCCDTDPLGGVCPHSTTVKDVIPPTVPQNFISFESENSVQLRWDASQDNVGVKGYEIWVNGDIIDIGHVLVFNHNNLPEGSTHTYKVRAYDFSGNKSAWTAHLIVTTNDGITPEFGDDVLEAGEFVVENGESVIEI